MGLEAATLASITAATSVTTAAIGISQNIRQRSEQQRAKEAQLARNKSQELEEQRRQIREERIRRARIMQSSENMGTQSSSGEAGAVGSLSTKLGSNLGFNLGANYLADQQTQAMQGAADAGNNARLASTIGQLAPTGINLAGSIFSGSTTADTSIFPMSDGTKQVGSRMGTYE